MKAPVSPVAISAAWEALMLHQPEPTNPTFCTCGWDRWHIAGDDLLAKHIAEAVAEAAAPFIAASALRDFARGDVADHGVGRTVILDLLDKAERFEGRDQ